MLKKYISDLKKEFKGYNVQKLSQDALSGLTVAAVALPLALAFGVSSGADAAAGLVTAIFAGLIIGSLSGASYQISGPTGAMAAILVTLASKYGIEGMLTAGLISGIILILAAILNVGRLVSYIPTPVITGFTSGIAIIIALGQVDNFFGTTSVGENAIAKLFSYTSLGFSPNVTATVFGLLVVGIMIIYPQKLSKYCPSSLFSLIVILIINLVINPDSTASTVAEVGSIPQTLITQNSLILNGIPLENITEFITPAISIAALGMIESLLCGASAGKMKGEKLDATRELMAQGIGNVIIPLFGGIPATAAIARTSVAIKSGCNTRLVSIFHSITLILSMFLLGPIMSRIPLSALAGVLMVTAWRMNDWSAIHKLFDNKLKHSMLQFFATMIATVVFDLTVAIVIGIVVAMFIFILKSSKLDVVVSDIDSSKLTGKTLPETYKFTRLIYLTGPLFFGTQDILTTTVHELGKIKAVIFSMRGVPSIDDSAINELSEIIDEFRTENVKVLFCGVQPHVYKTMERGDFIEKIGEDHFFWDAVSAIEHLEDVNL